MVALPALARSASASMLRRSYPTSINSSRAASRMACSRASARAPVGRRTRPVAFSIMLNTVCAHLPSERNGSVQRRVRQPPAKRNRSVSFRGGTAETPWSGPFASLGGAGPRVPRLQRGDGGSGGLECGTGGRRRARRRGRGGGRRRGCRSRYGGGGGSGGRRRGGRVDRELRPGDHGDLGAIGGRAEGGDDGPGQRAGDGLGRGLGRHHR